MLQPFFDFIEKFATDFSWKRLVIVVSLVILSLTVLYLYESQTAMFQLSKYERAVTILKNLESMKLESNQSKEVAENIYKGLSDVTKPSRSSAPLTATIPLELKQALVAASPWLLLCLFFIPGYFKGNEEVSNILGGSLLIGSIIGFGGYLMPIDWSSWITFGLYPFGSNIILFIILAWIGNKK